MEVFRDANPGYFQNPSAYTYLLHLLYRAVSLPFGGGRRSSAAIADNAEWIFELSRGLAAVLCLAGVAAVYFAERRCGTAAPGSSPPRSSASRSCRSRSRASR